MEVEITGVSASCGECDSCRIRLLAFAEVGVKDPINYDTIELAAWF